MSKLTLEIDEKEEILLDLDHLEIYVQVGKHTGKDALILRRVISKPEQMREILKRAMENEYIPARIKIKNKSLAAVRLKSLGLI